MKSWVGVDLDGTLAEVDYSKPYDYRHIGKPVPRMVERIRAWVASGIKVKILTARVSSGCPERVECIRLIQAWCIEHIGFNLEVTSEKDYFMSELWDDRCVQVIPNTGMALQEVMSRGSE
jgi:hydroxymethylpyrimidine pyrophosphatase-like HAD family hydrolase